MLQVGHSDAIAESSAAGKPQLATGKTGRRSAS
jgi:hypothetical protein